MAAPALPVKVLYADWDKFITVFAEAMSDLSKTRLPRCTIRRLRPEGTVEKPLRFTTEPHNSKPGRPRPVGPF